VRDWISREIQRQRFDPRMLLRDLQRLVMPEDWRIRREDTAEAHPEIRPDGVPVIVE